MYTLYYSRTPLDYYRNQVHYGIYAFARHAVAVILDSLYIPHMTRATMLDQNQNPLRRCSRSPHPFLTPGLSNTYINRI